MKTAEEIICKMLNVSLNGIEFAKKFEATIKIDDVLKSMHEFANQSRWIAVEDRLPEELLKNVLVCDKDGRVEIGWVGSNYRWYDSFGNEIQPILWQPLPSAPREEDKG